jgi:hypothetical protein
MSLFSGVMVSLYRFSLWHHNQIIYKHLLAWCLYSPKSGLESFNTFPASSREQHIAHKAQVPCPNTKIAS